jgi:hypothetical protein
MKALESFSLRKKVVSAQGNFFVCDATAQDASFKQNLEDPMIPLHRPGKCPP